MKSLLIIFSVMLFSTFDEDCRRHFHEGRYYYGDTFTVDGVQRVTNGKEIGYILRNNNIQTEIDPKVNRRSTFRIEWVSNCKYTLTYLSVINDSKPVFKEGDKIEVEIIEWTKSWYRYRSTDKRGNFEGKIYKVPRSR